MYRVYKRYDKRPIHFGARYYYEVLESSTPTADFYLVNYPENEEGFATKELAEIFLKELITEDIEYMSNNHYE